MATKMTIAMRSGAIHEVALDPNDMSAEEVAKEFHDGFDFSNTTAVQIGNKIFYTREIESFVFE